MGSKYEHQWRRYDEKIVLLFGGAIVLLVVGIWFLIQHFFFSLSSLPIGEYVDTYPSKDSHYLVTVYLVNGGATVDFAIRAELVNEEYHHVKNIYWGYKEDKATVIWLNNDIVSINGHKLNVKKGETYDWRRQSE
jgi:hypothetical protein